MAYSTFLYFFLLNDSVTTDFFFFNDTATTEIYTLSLHDALPIFIRGHQAAGPGGGRRGGQTLRCIFRESPLDRKSTRLNSSHLVISYAVFCLKKKNSNHVFCSKKQITHYDKIDVSSTPLNCNRGS